MSKEKDEIIDTDEKNSLKGFIPSEFKWITLSKQKKRAKELSSKTKKK